MQIQLHKILDVGMCYNILRSIRWNLGVQCTKCQSESVIKNGKDSTNPHVQRYHCQSCHSYFDDLSDTIFSGSHQPLHHWITVLYLMNLNASTLQITQELEISEDTVRRMCNAIREGIVKKNLILSFAETLNLTNAISSLDTKDNQKTSKKRAENPVEDV
ncbi:transposase [Arcicella rosea]|uniref:Transposase-like protein n=1 Tax=Arcicella rosea TaxID=502909 RepID=A0A841EPP3_9BACT|nr:transposase [Arcicella rosea]MBB6005762.1 transposase-like protein [Arcicella rosea]